MERDIYDLPVHGPDGRIAVIRRRLGLRQVDFARAVGTSRETVSHWENLGPDGEPRQRATRKNARAIAELARERLGLNLDESAFLGAGETAFEVLSRRQELMQQQLDRAIELLNELTRRLD
jgi:transcriptional regulator with XRE-family HTH domain